MNTDQPFIAFSEITAPINKSLKKVEQLILQNIETEIPLLTEIGQYILKSGGKRIRPVLLLLATGAIGTINEQAYKAANIIEFLHTASLLHDDVIDNAEFRRNKKSARTIWGNEASVLVGDYLFAFSFKYLGSLKNPILLEVLSNTATIMAQGEIKQLSINNETASEEDYLDIIYKKTASLMEASMEIGAVLGGASIEQQNILSDCGRKIGMAFQLVDDALDYDLNNKELGKPTGTDLKERKITLPLNHLLSVAPESERLKIRDILEGNMVTDSDVTLVCKLIERFKSIEYTIKRAREYTEATKINLKKLPATECSHAIGQLSDFIIYRKK